MNHERESREGPIMPEVACEPPTMVTARWEQTDLYRFFARVLAPPSRAWFEFLARPSSAAELQELGRYLGSEGGVPAFTWFATFELYESAYIRLFDVGLPEPVVPLFESAHDKTHPAQDIALENSCFYEVLGLKSDPRVGVPDYLITQLEFLAALTFTLENASEPATRASLSLAKAEFLQRHLLNWVPTAAAKLRKTQAPGFPSLMNLLVRFLQREHAAAVRVSAVEPGERVSVHHASPFPTEATPLRG